MVKQKKQKEERNIATDGQSTTLDEENDEHHQKRQPNTKKGQNKAAKLNKKGPRGHDITEDDGSIEADLEKTPQPLKKGASKNEKKKQHAKVPVNDSDDEEPMNLKRFDTKQSDEIEEEEEEEEEIHPAVKKGKSAKVQNKTQTQHRKGRVHDEESDKDIELTQLIEPKDQGEDEIPQPVKKGKGNKAHKKMQLAKGHYHDDQSEEDANLIQEVEIEDEIPQPVKKGKANKTQKKNRQAKGSVFDDYEDEAGIEEEEDAEDKKPLPVKKDETNKAQEKKQQNNDHFLVDDGDDAELVHEQEKDTIPQPVKKGKSKSLKKKQQPKMCDDEYDDSGDEVIQMEEVDYIEHVGPLANECLYKAEISSTCLVFDSHPVVKPVNDPSLIQLQEQVANMKIQDFLDDEKNRKKAEKEARKLLKAQKEAAKREKNLELIRQTVNVENEDHEDDEGIVYGAPDDVVWTDKSAAMLEAEKLNNSGPDLSLIYGADGKKLSNKERKKLQKDREAAQREEEIEKAAVKASAEGAQFACSQTAFSENDSQWQNSLDINIPSFSISAAGKILFKDSPFILNHGRRAGLVGPNGRGKSTLLKMINSRDLRLPPRIDYLYVEQEVVADETPAVEAVLKADKTRWNLIEEEKQLNSALDSGDEDPKRLARLQKVYEELSAIGADSAEAKARRILYGLGFDLDMQTKPTKMFSGGWRMRISLARALFMEPTLLMLDEPTNHLDLNAVIWLDDYLQRWKKTLLIVSHDQDFLNSVCEEIVHIEDLRLVTYKGDYDTFKKAQAIKMKEQQKSWEKQEKRLRELKRSGQSKAKATETVLKSSKREPGARSQKKTNDDIASGISTATTDELLKRVKEYAVKLEFAEVPELARPVLEVSKVHFRYSPNYPVIFDEIEFGIDMDSRITVVGPNGAGKSTLLKLLTGEINPTKGEVKRNSRLRMGIYNQHFVDRLPMNKTPVEHLRGQFQEEDYQSVRNRLGKYGLEGHAHEVVMRDLSGGQKARVVFVELSLQRPHILLLDEPTNNLDIETIDALIDAINEFNGGVVVVTHDQRLIEKCECDLWVVDKQRVIKWEAGFEHYKESLLKEMEEAIEKETADRKEKLEQIAAERADKLARLVVKLKSKT